MTQVEAIVNAVLYEGYMLYPYRPTSVKNRQRWTLGGLCPPAWSAIHDDEANAMHVECVIEGSPTTGIDIDVGFLQLVDRRVRTLGPRDTQSDWVEIDGRRYRSWQEATERRFAVPRVRIARLLQAPVRLPFAFDGASNSEPLRNAGRDVIGAYERMTRRVEGRVRLACERIDSDIYRLVVDVANTTPLPEAPTDRNAAMTAALVACHLVLHADGGEFSSLIDPPARLQQAAAGCRSDGAWPVLVGEQGARDTMLASPIILYDYPQIAPESAGELFDGTEIDEILSLRILAMTDAEKREMAAVDERTRALLERTERLTADQMEAMHGVMRRVDAKAADERGPRLSYWRGNGVELRVGDRVRLRPRGNADIFDLALSGMFATIQAIERDFDDRFHVAVTVDDDPGRDLGVDRMVGHRFFFAPDEIERVEQRL